MINYRDLRRVLVICPASLKINWCQEIRKWSTFELKPTYITGTKDCLLGDVSIINYELLKSHAAALREKTWDLVIIDEAHYLKSSKADRTAQVWGRKRARPGKPRIVPIPWHRLLLLTGTPILNKPQELWPLLQVLDPEGLGNDWFHYARRYCQLFEIERFDPGIGKKVHQGWKWDGADNLEELQALMRDRFMIRRLKKDVLTELPPKTRQVIAIEPKKGLTKLLNSEKLSYDDYVAKHGKDDIDPPDFTEMSKVMKEVAIAMIPYAIEYLKEVLSEKEEQKVAVWTHHHEVSDALIAAFGSEAVCVDGRVSIENRQLAVDGFQTDPRIKMFIGSIQAAGIGLTLTAASLALFVERSWTPALVTQAEDRLHRIGQKENVLIRHLVFNGSQDQRQVQALVRKQEIADRVLDKEKV